MTLFSGECETYLLFVISLSSNAMDDESVRFRAYEAQDDSNGIDGIVACEIANVEMQEASGMNS